MFIETINVSLNTTYYYFLYNDLLLLLLFILAAKETRQKHANPFLGVQFHLDILGNCSNLLVDNFVRVAGEVR